MAVTTKNWKNTSNRLYSTQRDVWPEFFDAYRFVLVVHANFRQYYSENTGDGDGIVTSGRGPKGRYYTNNNTTGTIKFSVPRSLPAFVLNILSVRRSFTGPPSNLLGASSARARSRRKRKLKAPRIIIIIARAQFAEEFRSRARASRLPLAKVLPPAEGTRERGTGDEGVFSGLISRAHNVFGLLNPP